ncbi:MAG: hypothetical protein ABSG41_10345 [Bryobacteraceae bacterium]
MIWRFADAPAKFRSLHINSSEPDWLVFVPRSFQSPDVDEAIVGGAASVSRYDPPGGGIVYVGMASIGSFAKGNVSFFQPPARMTAGDQPANARAAANKY